MKNQLNSLTTKADELYRDLVDGHATDETKEFMEESEKFLNNLVDYVESTGGRVDGLGYEKRHIESVTVHTYVDQVINNDDGKFDSLGSAWLTVPVGWVSAMIEHQGYESLEEFLNEYTYDNTMDWMDKAV